MTKFWPPDEIRRFDGIPSLTLLSQFFEQFCSGIHNHRLDLLNEPPTKMPIFFSFPFLIIYSLPSVFNLFLLFSFLWFFIIFFLIWSRVKYFSPFLWRLVSCFSKLLSFSTQYSVSAFSIFFLFYTTLCFIPVFSSSFMACIISRYFQWTLFPPLLFFLSVISLMHYGAHSSESIEWFLEDQAFLNDLDPPHPLSHEHVVSLSQSSCVSPVKHSDGGKGEIIRTWDSLVL